MISGLKWKNTRDRVHHSFLAWPKWLLLILLVVMIFWVKIDRKDAFYTRDFVVSNIVGEVLVRRGDGEWRDVRNGYILQEGESIRTVSGKAKLHLWLDYDFYLGEKSWLKVVKLHADPWIERNAILELVVGNVFVSAGETLYEKSGVKLIVGKELLSCNLGMFYTSLNEDGTAAFYNLTQVLDLNKDDDLWPGQFVHLDVGEEKINELKNILFEMQKERRVEIIKRIKKTVRVLYGDLLYGVKQNWSRFVRSLLVGEDAKRHYDLAWMEEVWMESILLSVNGDRDNAYKAILYARGLADDMMQDQDLYARSAKMYELASIFPEAQMVTTALIEELAFLNVDDYSLQARAIYRKVLLLLTWNESDDLKQQYIVDLAQTIERVNAGSNNNLKKELKKLMGVLVDK